MSRPAGLRRPKSQFFSNAESTVKHSAKRITSYFSNLSTDNLAAVHDPDSSSPPPFQLPITTPPTPPPGPQSRTNSLYGPPRAIETRHSSLGVPQSYLSDTMPLPSPKPSIHSFADRTYAGSLNARHDFTPSSAVFGPNGEILQAPVAPFAMESRANSRPSSRNSSRPGTSSGMSITPGPSKPVEIPRQRKNRLNRLDKDGKEVECWRLVPNSGANAPLIGFDLGPLIRGERDDDLWFPDGDTLVFLDKHKNPTFRIRSSQLMHTTLENFIDPVNYIGTPEERPAGHPDSFLNLPADSTDANSDASSIRKREDPPGVGPGDPIYNRSSQDSSSGSGTNSPPHLRSISGGRRTTTEKGILFEIRFPVSTKEDGQRKLDVLNPKDAAKAVKQEADTVRQRYIDARNLFAFLTHSYMVSTPTAESAYQVFNRMGEMLNVHAGNLWQMRQAEPHFLHYVDELRLDDVRNDDESILDALILGERWQCTQLWTEGFLHAAGRWEILSSNPAAPMLNAWTRARLDRMSLDLNNVRLKNVNQRLTDFQMPAVWIGEGRKHRLWQGAYEKMRTLVLSHMKHVFGSWPPKPGKKGKGGGTSITGGLNRIVLKQLYDDLCCLYDLLVDHDYIYGDKLDRSGARPSSGDEEPKTTELASKTGKAEEEKADTARVALRKIMQEFDTSGVPVQPTMPFDLPRIPSRAVAGTKPKKRFFFQRSDPKISSSEAEALLSSSYNLDARDRHASNPLVKRFLDHEKEHATGKSVLDFAEARCGRWIFIYCVLQSLPLTVVDAMGLKYSEGVEYFLCENHRDGYPWEKGLSKRATRMTGLWDAMASTTNLFDSNPDDDIDITYRRSHCWEVSEDWRLVIDSDEEEEYYDDGSEIEGYNPDGSPIFRQDNAYVPGQQIPESPSNENFTEFDSEPNNNFINGNQPQPLAYRPGPNESAWAPQARQDHYSQPSTDVYEFQPPVRMVSNNFDPAGIPLPGTPNGDSPYQIAPFNFDVGPEGGSSSRRSSRTPPFAPLPQIPPTGPIRNNSELGEMASQDEINHYRTFSGATSSSRTSSVGSGVIPQQAIYPPRSGMSPPGSMRAQQSMPALRGQSPSEQLRQTPSPSGSSKQRSGSVLMNKGHGQQDSMGTAM